MSIRQTEKETIRTLSSAEILLELATDCDTAVLPDVGVNIKRCIDALNKADKTVKERIKNEATEGALIGMNVKATIVESVRWNLNRQMVEDDMGEDWTVAHSKQSHVVSVRYGV